MDEMLGKKPRRVNRELRGSASLENPTDGFFITRNEAYRWMENHEFPTEAMFLGNSMTIYKEITEASRAGSIPYVMPFYDLCIAAENANRLSQLPQKVVLVYGGGDGVSEQELIEHMPDVRRVIDVDMSNAALHQFKTTLRPMLQRKGAQFVPLYKDFLNFGPAAGEVASSDFNKKSMWASWDRRIKNKPKLILMLGGTFGNLTKAEQSQFLEYNYNHMTENDLLAITVDNNTTDDNFLVQQYTGQHWEKLYASYVDSHYEKMAGLIGIDWNRIEVVPSVSEEGDGYKKLSVKLVVSPDHHPLKIDGTNLLMAWGEWRNRSNKIAQEFPGAAISVLQRSYRITEEGTRKLAQQHGFEVYRDEPWRPNKDIRCLHMHASANNNLWVFKKLAS